jgi:HSP20 family molecular chaperone IbpA
MFSLVYSLLISPDKQNCRPVFLTKNGKKIFQWIFDVWNVSPEDLTVKAVDGKVQVEVKVLQESEHFRDYFQASVSITPPKGANLQKVTSAVSFQWGLLKINVPYEGPVDGYPIPIQHQ